MKNYQQYHSEEKREEKKHTEKQKERKIGSFAFSHLCKAKGKTKNQKQNKKKIQQEKKLRLSGENIV